MKMKHVKVEINSLGVKVRVQITLLSEPLAAMFAYAWSG